MKYSIPENASVADKLRLFEKELDDKYERVDAVFQEKRKNIDDRVRLKAERAQIDIIRHDFKHLFECELRS